ncbi:hypothetical protein [Deinococcus cellulosilyticus]|uniref:Lipoprotein n=1 Tax=Deinococcus cellulosilyticus (strain DSM 18568 / NBRC 106333 / KACC 11606 / 5516J-15) TaxID=1223518 RepID=A0A511MZ08_DEIC1|nr:hypothetical protein [Deinococcus cellulosilyticus]GEM45377.1 hypothetical protein DC3_10120 [Deinococcus cellulosilyticus NBRC 106333 = KACC 11606]
MKKTIALITVTVLLAACGTQTPAPQKLTKNQLSSVAEDIIKSINADADRMVQSDADAFMAPNVGLFGGSISPTAVKKQQDESCYTLSGNTADQDEDGIYAKATGTLNCNFNLEGLQMGFKGTNNVEDKNDSDSQSGFMYGGNQDITLKSEDSDLTTKLEYGSDLTPLAGKNGYKASSYNKMDMNGTMEGQTFKANYNVTENITLEWTETTAHLKYDGNLKVSATAGNESFAGEISFDGDVNYDQECEGIESGTIKFTADGTSVTITYTGCDQYTVQ